MPKKVKQGNRRQELIVESLIKKLRRSLPLFKREPDNIQAAIASLLWSYGTKTKQHRSVSGAMFISYQERESRFGRGNFETVNNRLGIFDVQTFPFSKHLGNAYTPKPDVLAVADAYLHNSRRRTTSLLRDDVLRVVRTLPSAVASKDKDGITAKVWAKAPVPNNVAVDVDLLKALKLKLDKDLKEFGAGARSLFGDLNYERLTNCRNMLAKILRIADVDVAAYGNVPHHYEEATSGRLYATGVNLQNVPALIKEAALVGKWEYDIENCHYAIFQQMAAEVGFQCDSITRYLANKQGTRALIAHDVGITDRQAKECLISRMYGATESTWKDAAIPEAIGKKKAADLYQHKIWSKISAEIEQGRDAIVTSWPRTRKGTILNAAGKSMTLAGAQPKDLLAHLIQGVEALMLRAAFLCYPQEIVLLQHDGFVSSQPLDKSVLEAAILHATGYLVEFEGKPIQLSADFGASR